MWVNDQLKDFGQERWIAANAGINQLSLKGKQGSTSAHTILKLLGGSSIDNDLGLLGGGYTDRRVDLVSLHPVF